MGNPLSKLRNSAGGAGAAGKRGLQGSAGAAGASRTQGKAIRLRTIFVRSASQVHAGRKLSERPEAANASPQKRRPARTMLRCGIRMGTELTQRGAGRRLLRSRRSEVPANSLAARPAGRFPRNRQCVKSRHACVHVYTYRPSRGGDDRLDKSKERITNPSMLTITMVDPSRSLTVFGAIARPNVSAIYGTVPVCAWTSPSAEQV